MSVLNGMGPHRAINDNVNGLELLIVFDATSSLMIPYNRRLIDLAAGADAPGRLLTFDVIEEGSFPFNLKDRETGTVWSLTGIALTGELEGARFAAHRDLFCVLVRLGRLQPRHGDLFPVLELGMLQVVIGLRLERMCQQQDFRLTKELTRKHQVRG